MNTIMQTVTIQPNRQVSLNFAVPDDFPLGFADVSIQIHPSDMTEQYATRESVCKERHERMMSFVGALGDCEAFAEDAVTIQRRIRNEWDDGAPQIEDLLCKNHGK